MRDLSDVDDAATETLDAVTDGAVDGAEGGAWRANADVRSVPGSVVGWRRPVGRFGKKICCELSKGGWATPRRCGVWCKVR